MNDRVARAGIAVGIALLALIVIGAVPPVSSSADLGEGGWVCFSSDRGPVCVERVVTGPGPEPLLAALLIGPTPEERAQGLWSAVPEGTVLAGVAVDEARGTIVVRLRFPAAFPPARLDAAQVEAIVGQVSRTLTPFSFWVTAVEVQDPASGQFRALSDFLAPLPPPRKDSVLSGEEVPGDLPGYVGQPPVPGQGQPQGALSGKTIYISAGHGWAWDYDGRCGCYRWKTQRQVYYGFIEDHNNGEVVDQYLLQYLWNAGATVIPVRERDMNSAEVVVDDDAPGVGAGYAETGVWATTTASGTGYAGGDYRWTGTVTGAPTAAAVWTATLPVDGRYAVYVWYRAGGNRAPDARYTVHHAGGDTVVRVNQRHHGDTWHYIGTYGFRAGEAAQVTLDNGYTLAGQAVVADAVRFGGGIFDDLDGIATTAVYPPDKPWWEIATFYYAQKMGLDPDDWPDYNDVIARPMYARWEHAGSGDDAIYISWHTNGYNGTARGTESYIHDTQPVTGSDRLQYWVHTELVADIRAGWEAGWVDRGRKAADLGEVRELWDPQGEGYSIPGVLVEIAFHDHPLDAAALKEPAFNLLSARAIYQGIVKYYEEKDGTDLKLLPEPPTHLVVRNVGSGRLRISWQPSPTDGVGLVGDAATGYRVYTSADGLGWSNGIVVTGTTVYTLTGLTPGQLVFVRVTAANDGGESFPTEVLGARVGDGAGVLLVSGFDRLNSALSVPDYDPVEGYNLRMSLDLMNGYNYTVQHGEVISYAFDSAGNEAVQDGGVSLAQYAVVDWILGEEAGTERALNGTEQALLVGYLDSGGALFISGAEVGWELDYQGSAADRAFYNTYLRADYVGDDAETYLVAPASGSIFEGLASFRFDAGGMYDADYPDQIIPLNGSVEALTYQGGAGGTAAVQYADGCTRLVYFGFPFETIHPDQRAAVMGRVMGFLDLCLASPVDTEIGTPVDGGAYNAVPGFAGTAEAYASLDRVEVQVERVVDGQYWDGGGWGIAATWLTASGADTWSYALPPTALDDGNYRLRARAWTVNPYPDTTPAEVVIIYDTIAPTATVLITPTGGVALTMVSDLVLQWEPVVPDGGASLAYLVELDRQVYTTTQAVYTVTTSLAGGLHTWRVRVVDAAGNQSDWVTGTFFVEQHSYWLPLVIQEESAVDVIVNGGFETDEG